MKHLKTIIGIAALFIAFACVKSPNDGVGQVVFEVASNQSVADVTKSNVSDYTSLPSAGDFTISIKDAANALLWTGKISEWNPVTPLQMGTYTVDAEFGAIEAEGFDKPYFLGTKSFTVVGAESTAVSIPVALGNTIVKIACSDYFKNYFNDYTFKITRDGADVVSFAKDETRAAFVDGYKFTVEGTLSSETATQTFTKDFSNLDEATAYTLTFDVSNVGGSTITITFDDTVEEVALGNVELND